MLFIHMVEICSNGKCIEIGRDLFEKALNIRQEMIKRGDLRTRWWVRFIGAIFRPVDRYGNATFSHVDTGGTSRTAYVKNNLGSVDIMFNTTACNNKFWISVGDGTTSPAIDDYKLASKIAETSASYVFDEVNGIITLSAGFTFTSDTVITEIGLEWECPVTSYNVCGRILVDRTLLSSPFTAPAGTPITVSYKILV